MEKQHIINEIRRIAKANGGKLGRETFYRATGIKESDWIGKYWARWSDAVRESGFEPNKMQVAYGEQELIDKFIELMRELGHFPVTSEIRLKIRSGANFPNDKTFAKFGTKQQFVARILEYCAEQKGYDDVVAMCKATMESARTSSKKDVQTDELLAGVVYLIQSGDYYKIGRANSLGRRERELKIQLPEIAHTIHSIPTDDTIGIENYWHNRFRNKRKNGEWFELTALDIKAFKRRKFM